VGRIYQDWQSITNDGYRKSANLGGPLDLIDTPNGQLAGYLAHLSVFSREYDFAQGKLSFLTHCTFDLNAKEFPTAWVNMFDLLRQDH